MNNKQVIISLFFGLFFLFSSSVSAFDPSGEFLPASMLIHGNTLYLAAPDMKRITAYDISDPTIPKPKANFQTSGMPCSLAIEGSRLYAVDTLELFIFDISDPGILKLVSRKKYASDPVVGPVAVCIQQGDIWLARRSNGVFANDEPAAGFYARCFASARNGRVFAIGPRVLRTVDHVSDPLEIPIQSGSPVSMTLIGPDLFVAVGCHGVTVFQNVFDMHSIWETGSVRRNTGKFRRLDRSADGGVEWTPAELSMEEYGPLGIYANPTSFVCNMAYDPDRVPVRYLFLAAGGSGIVTADILKQRSETRYVAICSDLEGHICTGVIVKRQIIYAYEPGYGLHTLDASDPLNIRLIQVKNEKQKRR